jgi:SAM-dependent methyltransferase
MHICDICSSKKFEVVNFFPNLIKKQIKFIIYYTPFLYKIFKKLCKDHDLAKHLNDNEKIFLLKKISFCKSCRLGMVYPKIKQIELNSFYTNDYWKNRKSKIKNSIDFRNYKRIDYLKKYIKSTKSISCLELGLGNGQFACMLMKSKKKIVNYFGIELDKKNILKKLLNNKYFCLINDIKELKNNSIDIFISIQSVEHLIDLKNFFEVLKNKIKKNSLIYIETPNYNEDYIRCYRAGWPPHTYYFNKKSITKLSQLYNFKIINLELIEESWEKLIGIKTKKIKEGHNMRFILKNND